MICKEHLKQDDLGIGLVLCLAFLFSWNHHADTPYTRTHIKQKHTGGGGAGGIIFNLVYGSAALKGCILAHSVPFLCLQFQVCCQYILLLLPLLSVLIFFPVFFHKAERWRWDFFRSVRPFGFAFLEHRCLPGTQI